MEILIKIKTFLSGNDILFNDIKKNWENVFLILSVRLKLMAYSS